MTTTREAYVAWATAQLGVMEDPLGSNQNIYAPIAGHANGAPWCASFVVAAAVRCGVVLPAGAMTAWTPGNATAYKAAGRFSTTPEIGSTGFVFYPWLNNGRIGHTFIVEAIDGDHVITVEGNTNNDGSRVGLGVFRHRRLRSVPAGQEGVVGYGHNVFAASALPPAPVPKPPAAPAKPVVSLSGIVSAAKTDPKAPQGHATYRSGTFLVENALVAEGLLANRWASDGSYGTKTVASYAAWQRRLGFSGAGADGVPGRASLKALGARHGFTVGA